MDTCELCGHQKELQNSHIIPRFVIRWLKKSGATGFLRKAKTQDRIQDHHEKLLCTQCEQLFSDWEREFASNIFYPKVRDEQSQFQYGPWLKKFIISISWRLLVSEMSVWRDEEEYKSESISEAADIWKRILNDELPLSADPYTHHIFFFDYIDIESADEPLPENYEFYTHRSIDGTSVFGTASSHVYFKFPEIAFFSCIQPPEPSGLNKTKVEDEGTIGSPQELGPDWGDFLLDRVEGSQYSLSDSENKKILDKMREDPEKVLESKTLETMIQKMRRDWAQHDITDHLDEPECPVCHTNHIIVDGFPDSPLTESHIKNLSEQFEYVNATFPDDQYATKGIPTHVTDSIIISTSEMTKILMYYMDTGWIVVEELPHGGNPRKAGEEAYEHYQEELDDMMNEKY